ncbi:M-like protein [Deinococcus sp. KSM4-11]|uniref:M-like protein n=1 Tax=Deinococcus sp. KSM4-11 TaxID=2568654 RepID=UPI0010A48EF5|nr:M-like protein [Deinococcus sp. KSM4-11]THF87973.1 M-like protein [Deinococcus sp. KSM4-11]
MTHDDDKRPSDQQVSDHQVSNVDLQFMGRTDQQGELDATVDAESKAPGEYKERGMDKQDVAVAQSMDASDPPSTNMGEDDADK